MTCRRTSRKCRLSPRSNSIGQPTTRSRRFDFFEQTPVENVILRKGVQIDYPGNTTGAVYEWMRVNELHVFDTKLIGSQRFRRWHGRYRVTFAR